MDNFLYSLVFFIVALGLLIAIHEFGHYWVAKKLGVKVLRFSIGFGFPLWRRVRGEDKTEYVIAAIPLGGYVKMLDERDPDCPVLPEEQHRAFNRQPVSTRIAVVAAGPLFNFAFAILAYWALFMMGVPGVKPLIGEVQPGSLFAQAGIAHGDLVLSIDDEPMPTLENVRLTLMEGVLDQSVLNVTVQREDMSERELQLDLSSLTADALDEDFMQALGFSPLRPLLPAVLAEVQTSGAAHAAGLQSGDQIIEVDGLVIEDWEAWASYVREHPGQALAVKILRQNQTLDLTVTPATVESPTGPIGRVGAMPDVPEELISEFRAVQRYGVLAAIPVAIEKTWDMSVMTLVMLWKMLVGKHRLKISAGH